MIKVSILVPIYGVEKYIEKCVRSLFEQTYSNIEYIFVNDNTMDKSISILENVVTQYSNRQSQIRVINHTENKGLASARLTGLKYATGDYVWFIDSDDWIEKRAVSTLVEVINKFKPDAVRFNYYQELINGSKAILQKPYTTNNLISLRIPAMIWGTIFKHSLFEEYKIYPIPGLDISEDYIMTARLSMITKRVVCLNDFLYHYNCTNMGSYTNNVSEKSLIQAAKGALIVSEFIKKNTECKKYRLSFYSVLTRKYLRICSSSSQSKLSNQLYVEMKKINKMLSIIIRILGNRSISLFLLKCYSHVVSMFFNSKDDCNIFLYKIYDKP